jgi:amino acid transporter
MSLPNGLSRPPLLKQLSRRKPVVMQQTVHLGEELERSLSTFQLMMFGVGATVGTGIFFVLSEAIPKAGAAVLISFGIAALAAGLSALCYAELSSAVPVSGSTYSYTYHALGEGPAVFIAACVLLEYAVAVSAVAVGWSSYFNELLHNTIGIEIPHALRETFLPFCDPNNGWACESTNGGIINLPAILLIVMCMFLLLRGASESATINAIMVLIKLGVLILFCVIGFSAFQADHFDNFFAQASGISAAAGTIFFSFIGLDAVATAGEEVKNPQKALPRAIIGALIIVTAIYILVAAAGLAAKPVEFFSSEAAGEAGLSRILQDVTGSTVWPTILAAGAVISIFSVTLVTLYGQTRILFSVSRDGLIPRRFEAVNPRTMTPTFNTVVVSIVVACIAGFVPSSYLWDTVSIGTLMAFTAVAIAIMVMRRTHPELERPFKVPLYPTTWSRPVAITSSIVVSLAVIGAMWMWGGYAEDGTRGLLWTVLLTAIALACAFLFGAAFVPILTVLVCLYVLSGLSPITWIIFGVWVVVVFGYYFGYGLRNATLNHYTSLEEIAEPIPVSKKADE